MTNPTKKEMFDAGLAIRKEVLGSEYVDRGFAIKDEFTEDIQDYLTVHSWGASWGRRDARGELTIPKKTRSWLNIVMLCALNRPHELKMHIGGALRNGVTRTEIREVLLQVAIYCGIPAGVDAFRVAKETFAEFDKNEKK